MSAQRMDLPVTGWAVGMTEPHDWNHVADYVYGLIRRAPVTSRGWEAERILLGAFASELRGMARDAGEPTEDPDEARAYEAHLDRSVMEHQRGTRADREHRARR